MKWEFDGDGMWTAFSAVTDDGSSFEWRIAVCDDGTFCVNESDAELTDRKETFDTLRDAKTWCEEKETDWVRSMMQEAEAV